VLNETEVYPAFHHHFIAYSCTSGELPREYQDGENHQCSVAPPIGCAPFFIGWALGQITMDFRPAGYPIGAGGNAAHRAVVGQAHVDHPTLEPGIHLSAWGLRFWVTPTMQEFEGTTFGFYLTFDRGIPPQEPRWEIRGELGRAMWEAHIPDEGITFQMISPHAHGLQSGAKLQVIRDGVERPDLGYEISYWDYNTQDTVIRNTNHLLTLYRGDRIIYTCIFNTTGKTERTYWGEGFADEMCILYTNVYPSFKNHMMTCATLGNNPNFVEPDEVAGSFCVGDAGPYTDLTLFNDTWILPPPPPSVCLEKFF